MPLYPMLALITALPLYQISKSIHFSIKNVQFAFPLFTAFIFIVPFSESFAMSRSNNIMHQDYDLEVNHFYLHDQLDRNTLSDLTVYHHGYKGSVLCYKYMYQEKGSHLTIKEKPFFIPDEKVLVSNDSLENVLLDKYDIDTLEIYSPATVYKIKNAKK